MASVITAPQYDPIPTAEKLATKAVAAQKAALQAQNTLASNTSTALGNLKSAISAFQSAMSSMTSSKSVLSQSATFPAAGYGTATAGINATPGTYSFFVEKLATASQMSYGGLSSVNTADGTGTLKVKIGDGVGDNTLDIDLAAADKDGNGTLTPQEIAAAINGNSKNNSRVTASIVTINNQAQLVLTSNATGIANAATLDASAVDNIALKGALIAPANIKEVVKADDATVWLGGKPGGTAITQASNTFTNVQDVKITFTRAMTAAEAPVTLTVATDNSGTAANVQAFVDAYNKLKTLMDGLASPGNPEKNIAAGIFAHDSGLNALRSSMGNALRLNVNGVSLVSYGITAQRDGTISLNAAKLTAKLADNPTGLDKLFGNNSLSAPAGVLGSLDKVLGQWSNVTKGQITQRQAATDKLQKSLVKSGERLTAQYDTAYKRFLDQFSRLQVMQEQMSKTSDMFDAMFSNNKS
ncbi:MULTISPECIES: flagellar filament capping protein FliD [unclassified Janthinobacterium]|uniref:flagellar filament capping protein FliD n=1 Tax=unclassified Janthinobacterium TaxID=2610881 RepID=UPI0025AF36AB|nr:MULTISPECIES: flagellar filament capping protein FliD [unclassified Janthinobacterium]MDN2714662.1 flagellar filament capping protein FliD [Janthinobacterium sp. SUN120]MDO8040534.1 flagellar filament capping protein FliD [Janthinobacterium sp. SUN137]MDO8046875.1 flagellar filament capping protein FliD [Janthinobacterium sp. SUN211]